MKTGGISKCRKCLSGGSSSFKLSGTDSRTWDYYGTAYPDKSYGGDYIYPGDYRKAAEAERI